MEINTLIDAEFEGHLREEWLQSVAQEVLNREQVSDNAELGLVLTSQEKVRELNKRYRGRDQPTDVLAFYMQPAAPEADTDFPAFVTAPDNLLHLGEVIISFPQAVIQAKEHHHSIAREIAILIIHGVLHLLGYHHETPAEKRRMSAREVDILSQIEERL